MTATPMAHPSTFIEPHDADIVRSFAADAERAGRLLPDQLALIYERNWFNVYVPSSHGGLELSLAQGLRLEEGLAWADGSLGWTVTLCSGANWFVRFLEPELARGIFSDPKACLAGSGRPSGIASLQPDGSYVISGHWKYATGAPHATAFTANCVIQGNGMPSATSPALPPATSTAMPPAMPPTSRQTEDGPLTVRAFLFLAGEVTIVEDWDTTGMIATASHSFLVDNLRVPAARCFMIDAEHARLPLPADQRSFLAFAEATLAVNSSGMAARFLDLAAGIFSQRAQHDPSSAHPTDSAASFRPSAASSRLSAASSRPTDPHRNERSVQLLQLATQRLQSAREEFYSAVATSAASLSVPSRHLAATALRVVDELYPWCGLTAATAGTEINRVWRDLHTASQHGLLLN